MKTALEPLRRDPHARRRLSDMLTQIANDLAICVLALALLERDGLATLVGLSIGVAAVALAWEVILGIVKAVSLFVRHWLAL